MGCATSKQAQQDLSRSPSPLPHDHHVVSFSSSILHSINLKTETEPQAEIEIKTIDESSKLVPTKNPKWILCTPTMTPPNEPETINTWELMADLDHSLLSRPTTPPPPVDRCSFSFQSVPTDIIEFDQEVLSAFRKAMEELSPVHPALLRSSPKIDKTEMTCNGQMELMINQMKRSCEGNIDYNNNKVVVYFTSLRGVRKTFEDCCLVRMILQGYGVRLDERDLSMHRGFRDELQQILGEGINWQLPRVFVEGDHIGGVEEVKQMHETGELASILKGCEKVSEEGNRPCNQCGDARFMVCQTCSGSCKLCIEEIEEELEDQEDIERREFMRCPDCNENGIVRCNLCC
ncbi:Glutaredoxin [Carex littledalei]|uniref:Glutaredoxin n=1 Tax=Carex littledalei TaxID=544730 RepID=A0A833QNY6_9POAL|nr:Glutaredoxin [Carex littledalei]